MSRSARYVAFPRVSLLVGIALATFLQDFGSVSAEVKPPTNVLLITADDLNYDSLGVTGSSAPKISPNLDRLASEGMLLTRAHVNIAVCQPCRQCLMTGRYPHRNGGIGFNPIRRDVSTLGESLCEAGYFQGIMAKVGHLAPQEKYCWDLVVPAADLANGRDPKLYNQHAAKFFAQAKQSGKPFFLMANAQDPHRPFAGSDQEKSRRQGNERKRRSGYPDASRHYKPDEIDVPKFLPDIPEVRREIAEYYTSVHRCDEVVGGVLKALDDAGHTEDTLVIFLSDHGMALPFAKTNCYHHSTHTPLIVRWPGVVQPNSKDETHFVSTIDLTPTILAALGLAQIERVDGRSFLPVLKGNKQEGRDCVFTMFHQTSGRRNYEMRAVNEARFGYIWNPWSDGEFVFRNESQNGRTMKAMREAASADKQIAARVRLFLYRTPEELFNYHADPDGLNNLIGDQEHQEKLNELRTKLLENMRATEDPLAEKFAEFIKR